MLITSTKNKGNPIFMVFPCNTKPKLLVRSIHFFHSSRSWSPVSWCWTTVRLNLGELLLIENLSTIVVSCVFGDACESFLLEDGCFSFDFGEWCLGSPTTWSRINLSTLFTLGSNSWTNLWFAIGCTFSVNFGFLIEYNSFWSIKSL